MISFSRCTKFDVSKILVLANASSLLDYRHKVIKEYLPFFSKVPNVEVLNPDGTAFIAFKTSVTVVCKEKLSVDTKLNLCRFR